MANDINISVGVFAGDALRDLARVQGQVQAVGNKINSTTRVLNQHSNAYNKTAVATNKWAKGALQQTGYQLGDFFVQVTNGTSAMQAFGQQGSQILGVFGPVGALLGAAVAIFAAFGVAAERSGQHLGQFAVLLGSLQAPVMAVVQMFRDLGLSFEAVSKFMLHNIDTVIIALGLFAARFLLVKAAMAVYSLAMGVATARTAAFKNVVVAAGAALRRFLPIAILLGLAKMIELLLRAKDGVGGFGKVLGLLKDIAVEVITRIATGFAAFGDIWDAVSARIQRIWLITLREIQQRYATFLHIVARSIPELPGMEDMILSVGSAAIEAGSKVYETSAAIDELNQKGVESANKAGKGFRDMIRPLDSMVPLVDAINAGTKEIGDLNFGNAVEETGKLKEALDPIPDKIEDLRKSITSSMENAFMSMVDGTKGVKDAFKAMARDIILELYRVLVVQQLVNAISNTSAFKSAFSLATLGLRANGGPVNAGTPYVVGEKGPEVIVPGRSGVVIPNSKLSGGGETVIVNQTINVSTGVQQTVRNEIKQMMPMLADNAKAAVLDAKRRGGTYGRAFA